MQSRGNPMPLRPAVASQQAHPYSDSRLLWNSPSFQVPRSLSVCLRRPGSALLHESDSPSPHHGPPAGGVTDQVTM
jgi:hypothetical protein